jgi:hypothetical protein
MSLVTVSLSHYNISGKGPRISDRIKAISFQVGKRYFCIKIAVFSVGSLFDIKKTYLSLTFQYLNDLCLTNLKRLSLSASYFYILICLSEILGPFPEIL